MSDLISRQAAIDVIYNNEYKKDMRKELEHLPSVKQEPCEDAISRQAVLDLPRIKTRNVRGNVIKESVDVEDIQKLPPIKPQEPKTGHWIVDKGSLDALYGEVCECSECGIESIGESGYCPYCGAKMERSDKG